MSGQVAFLTNGTLPSGFSPQCLAKNSAIPGGIICDWHTFFQCGQDDPVVQARSRNVTTWEITSDPKPQPGHPSMTTLAIDFSVYQASATYFLDTSWITNKLSIATFVLDSSDRLGAFGPLGSSLPVDPSWSLAAWAVDRNGNLTSTRAASTRLQDVFTALWRLCNNTAPLYEMTYELDGIALMPIIQLLSIIDHRTVASSNMDPALVDPSHPLLQVHARMNVWAYGISSRTAYLGVVVASFGCLVVLLEVVLGLVYRRRFWNPTQLLVAALAHSPQDDYKDAKGYDRKLSRLSFEMTDDVGSAGGFKFTKAA